MTRSGSFFVALCMVAIAVSAAALAYLVAYVEAGYAAAIGFGVMLAMVIGYLGTQRAADRTVVDARLTDLTRASGAMARDIAELSRRVERFETVAMDKARAATEPIAEEIGELGALVKQFAETLQVHEAAIVRATAAVPLAPPEPVYAAPAPPVAAPAAPPLSPPLAALVATPAQPPPQAQAPLHAPPQAPAPSSSVMRGFGAAIRQRLEPPAPPAAPGLPEAFAGLDRAAAVALIEEAVAAGRIDLYLQPIVTLPQRKVRFYHASAGLRGAAGQGLARDDYRTLAEEARLMPALDAEILGRCIQVVRRLSSRNREVGLVCDLSGAALADGNFAARLLATLDEERALAGSLMLGFTQADMRAFSPLDIETLRAAADHGFRFSLAGVTDLRFEPHDLADLGFRQVRVPAELMLRAVEAGATFHPADLSGLFSRYGIDLVVEAIEAEPTVVDLLDYDVRFAQGDLFSPPRPVRADVLSGGPGPQPAQPQPSMSRAPRAEQRPAPQTLGAAALASGAVGGRDQRRAGGIGQGLRALIRERN